ncbi:MAG: T9SS type A sorting domain-containing protein [Dysgonamonadaceae bacterium]|jgi:hypothetical protein|nr:T9SS type A sorting domain-containing protein [Dysgonamonadaceae bacterium]
MKTTITLLAMLSVLSLSAQETKAYLPIFSETGTTTFCYWDYWHCSDCPDEAYCFSLEFLKDEDLERTYKLENINWGSFYGMFDKFTVSEDNSKLWGSSTYFGSTYTCLLMDLNLNIGDTFDDINNYGSYYYQFIVSDVYQRDGRKHIEFASEFALEEPLIFIEGMGPTRYPSYSYEMFLKAKCIDRVLEYFVPSMEGKGCDCGYYYNSEKNTTVDNKIRLYPLPVNTELTLKISETVDIENAQVNIYDMKGNLQILHTSITNNICKCDVSTLTPGIYFLRIISSNINENIKFIKS